MEFSWVLSFEFKFRFQTTDICSSESDEVNKMSITGNLLYSIVISAACCFSSSIWANSFVLEAKKNNVKVLSKPQKTSPELKVLKKGESIPAKSNSRKGMYWVADLDGKDGYISIMQVSRKKSGDSGFSDAIRKAVQKSRAEGDAASPRTRSAVMGVRGLAASSDVDFAGNTKPNLRLVYNMESYIIPQNELDSLGDRVLEEIAQKQAKRETKPSVR